MLINSNVGAQRKKTMENKSEKVFNILEATKTNWTVNKLPLITAEGYPTGSFGIFRNDSNKWLGTVKQRYEPMNNHSLVELLVDATDMLNLELKKGGVLGDGGKVYYQIGLPDEYVGKSGIKRFITALNSHDGSTSIALGSTNVVIVCQNTFYKSYREMEKVKHTANSYGRVKLLADEIKNTVCRDNNLMETFKRMADVNLKDEMVERLIKKIFPKTDETEMLEELSTVTKKKLIAFADNLDTEIKLEGKTVWGLFNAVTRYTNHTAAPQKEEDKMKYIMNGAGYRMSNIAFNELVEIVEKNTAEYHFINA